MTKLSRRTLIRGAAGTLVLGTIAGCTGDDGGGDGGDGNDDGGDGGNGDDGGGNGDPESSADSYLSDNDANEYGGDIEDHTGEDSVTVEVGGGSQGLAFDPPGIRIETGTTVMWEWTGEGGDHNVVPDGDSDFEDFGVEERIGDAGHTEEHTFDETGAGLYVCQPHQAQGMYGAVVVE